MADLNDLQVAQPVKIVGSDSTGNETNPQKVDVNGSIYSVPTDASGLELKGQRSSANSVPVVLSSDQAPFRYSIATNTRPPVTNTSSVIVAANANRRFIRITNNTTVNTLWIKFGAAAITGEGLKLSPGVTYESEAVVFTGDIHAIHSDIGTINIDVEEGT